MTLSDSDLVRLLGLAEGVERAMSGPWDAVEGVDGWEVCTALDGDVDGDTGRHLVVGGEPVAIMPDVEGDCDLAAFIAAASPSAIRSMVEELQAARKALEPFAEAADHLHPSQPDDALTLDGIEVRHWRAARAAATHHEEG